MPSTATEHPACGIRAINDAISLSTVSNNRELTALGAARINSSNTSGSEPPRTETFQPFPCSILVTAAFSRTHRAGNAAATQRLRTQRSKAVANDWQQTAGLAPGGVRAGDGMGVAPDAGNGSNSGARKVVVKLVVDKGVQAGANPPAK